MFIEEDGTIGGSGYPYCPAFRSSSVSISANGDDLTFRPILYL